jgi:hypothetical protein
MLKAEQELLGKCSDKNCKIKIVDLSLFELQTGKPDVLFYNIPVKSIHSGEENLKETVVKNVLETKRLINFAQSSKIPSVFILSGSGALNARNWIGATQRLGELLAQFADSQHRKMFTKFKVIRIPDEIGDSEGIFRKTVSSIFSNGYINYDHQNFETNAVYYRKDILPLLVKAVTFLVKSNDVTSAVYTIAPKNNITFDDYIENICKTACLRPYRDVQIIKSTKSEEMKLDDFIDINEPIEKTAIAGILRTKFTCNSFVNYSDVWTIEEINTMTTRELISAVFQNLNEKIKA